MPTDDEVQRQGVQDGNTIACLKARIADLEAAVKMAIEMFDDFDMKQCSEGSFSRLSVVRAPKQASLSGLGRIPQLPVDG